METKRKEVIEFIKNEMKFCPCVHFIDDCGFSINYLLYELFYSNHGEQRYQQTYHGLFPAPNPKNFLEDYFKIQLP